MSVGEKDRRDKLQSRIEVLRTELKQLEAELQTLDDEDQNARTPQDLPLRLDEYRRYGRQMILPPFGLTGQKRLKNAKVLVVGAGGLGCPVLLYLAGAGVGHITIVDNDTVDYSNLHRQVLHTTSTVGMNKAESAKEGMRQLNPLVKVEALAHRLTRSTFVAGSTSTSSDSPQLELSSFTLVVDCTDNARTRYLLSDSCVQANVTLCSGGAIGLEGWVGVWNLPPAPPSASPNTESSATQVASSVRGPCLRCIYPQTKHDNAGNCEDEGVLGTVTGVIGTLMASEAIKLLSGMHDLKPAMTLFSPLSSPMFRNLKIRGRKPTCPGCGPASTEANGASSAVDDQAEYCGVLEAESDERISAKGILQAMKDGRRPKIIDVRPEVEFEICSLPNSQNIPHTSILRQPELLQNAVLDGQPVVLVCRRGNDSLLDARSLRTATGSDVKDLRGGLQAWSRADPGFPMY